MAASMPPPTAVECFSERYMDGEEVVFQIIQLPGATYLWIGTPEARQENLAMGVPSASARGPPAAGTTLLGGGLTSNEGVSQIIAQRLARKLGKPVFVSFNLRDEAELRLFAERHALEGLKRVGASAPKEVGVGVASAAVTPAAVDSMSTSTVSTSIPAASIGDAIPPAATPAAAQQVSDTGVGARSFDVFDTPASLGDAAAAILLGAASQAITARGFFCVALSGGSIPSLLCPALLAAAETARFELWHIFLADER